MKKRFGPTATLYETVALPFVIPPAPACRGSEAEGSVVPRKCYSTERNGADLSRLAAEGPRVLPRSIQNRLDESNRCPYR